MAIANDNSASGQFSELRQRAENALQKRPSDNLELAGLTNETKLRTAITDITDRKMTDQQLQASLKEKEVLLQEVHHRVKNNMQIMISLISLQCEKVEDKNICDLFNKTVNRINSMALVHKQLYKSKNFSKVDITEYVTSIVENLFASYSVDPNIIKNGCKSFLVLGGIKNG
jgi:light-regulated signal transduction histidine kinase (bacteriophytochrome)